MKLRVVVSAVVAVLLFAICFAGRLLPHPPNATPVAAVALFAGFYFRHRLVAFAIPTLGMLASDAIIGTYNWKLMCTIYVALILPVLFKKFLQKLKPHRVGVCSVAASLVFFVATNLGVWLFTSHYSKDIVGIGSCFAAAIPFLKYTIIGDLFWNTVFFGTYGFANSSLPSRITNSLTSALRNGRPVRVG